MAGHDPHRHVEISDGERVVAAAEVTANGHACPRSGECAAAQAVADAVAKAAGLRLSRSPAAPQSGTGCSGSRRLSSRSRRPCPAGKDRRMASALSQQR
jgi:hypothetical protein